MEKSELVAIVAAINSLGAVLRRPGVNKLTDGELHTCVTEAIRMVDQADNLVKNPGARKTDEPKKATHEAEQPNMELGDALKDL